MAWLLCTKVAFIGFGALASHHFHGWLIKIMAVSLSPEVCQNFTEMRDMLLDRGANPHMWLFKIVFNFNEFVF